MSARKYLKNFSFVLKTQWYANVVVCFHSWHSDCKWILKRQVRGIFQQIYTDKTMQRFHTYNINFNDSALKKGKTEHTIRLWRQKYKLKHALFNQNNVRLWRHKYKPSKHLNRTHHTFVTTQIQNMQTFHQNTRYVCDDKNAKCANI